MIYYLVGIKGTGMSALACYLKDLGHVVLGSDVEQDFEFNEHLKSKNIQIMTFNINNLLDNYTYIIGNSYDCHNIEVNYIINHEYKYYYYNEFISTLDGVKIAVSGTHGKTTTCTFLTQMLDKKDIAYIIGDGNGYASLNYKYLIFEACEYQEHFLTYKPDYLLITNIDYDHPDYYSGISDTINAFYKLTKRSKKVITLGNTNYQIISMNKDSTKLLINNHLVKLNIIGIHNINNYILCYELLKCLGISDKEIIKRSKKLSLPTRRFKITKYLNNIIISDYAHHPTEINALKQSIDIMYPNTLKIAIFQPHTYTRTIKYIDLFINALDSFDEVYIDKTFTSSREKASIKEDALINQLFSKYKRFDSFNYQTLLNTNNVYCLIGAGDINIRFIENLNSIKSIT